MDFIEAKESQEAKEFTVALTPRKMAYCQSLRIAFQHLLPGC